ncbi:recombinase family protein [Paenibacillus sp. LPE1-1-1.1]|uniref:recombinase family protein n=1 Tax=Paenibacillus sp. LPE1-1-1.1 TaxID=3135230 RepID=UPI00341ABCDF
MKAVFYARVSTDSEDQLNSLSNQLDFFDNYIKEEGYEKADSGILFRKNNTFQVLSGGYADEGISGKSLKKREAFKLMIQDAMAKKFNLIITKSVARFGRSVEDTAKTIKDLKEVGVGVYFLDLKINSLDNSKEFMINLFSSLAQEDSNNKSYIIQFGIRKAQQAGKFTGHAPYGYEINNGYLVINETEAEVVKVIYNKYYYESCGTGKIVRYLNEKQIPTKKGVKWSQIQVSRILDNTIYKGLQIQHMNQTIDINRDIQIAIPEEDWIKQQKDELIIIEPSLFDLVQFEKQKRLEQFGHISYQENKYIDEDGNVKVFKARRIERSTGRHSNQHVFSNLLYCHNCKSSLKRKKRKAFVRKDGTSKELGYEWSCAANDMYGSAKCKHRNSFTEEYLLTFIKDEVIKFKKEKHEVTLDNYIFTYIKNDNEAEDKLNIEMQIVKLNNRSKLILELLSEGLIDKEEFTLRNKEVKDELRVAKNDLDRLMTFEVKIQETKLKYNQFINFIQNFDENNITNSNLRKIINNINAYTFDIPIDHPEIDPNNPKILFIEWSFLDKVESQIYEDMAQKEIRKFNSEHGFEENLDESLPYTPLL